MIRPVVSVVVPTRNSAATLGACLSSICAQTYTRIELIVVDNHSTDNTTQIASRYTEHIFSRGPERSAQRNYGVSQAEGDYVAIIDSDMELSPKVLESCVNAVAVDPGMAGLIIPEESFGEGYWAQCKRLERSFYVGVPGIEAARFFPRNIYVKAGGYDEALVSGEDWDLSRRIEAAGRVGHVAEFIRHNEGRLALSHSLKKKYYYGRHARAFTRKQRGESMLAASAGPVQRYVLFFSKPGLLWASPSIAVGMLSMKFLEYLFGALGYVVSNLVPVKKAGQLRG